MTLVFIQNANSQEKKRVKDIGFEESVVRSDSNDVIKVGGMKSYFKKQIDCT